MGITPCRGPASARTALTCGDTDATCRTPWRFGRFPCPTPGNRRLAIAVTL